MAGLTISYGEVALRLLVTVLLCGAIGFEREVRDQPAGFRTHILLGLGATLFTLVSAHGFPTFTEAALERSRGVQFDPTRIAAQIVTGVGFLGAGAIIRQGRDVRGLTTAASLWAVAAIGTAVGAGYLFGAAATTLLVMATLFVLRRFRASVIGRMRLEFAEFSFTLADRDQDPEEILEALKERGVDVRSIDAEVSQGRTRYTLQVRISSSEGTHGILRDISRLPGVERASITGLHDIS